MNPAVLCSVRLLLAAAIWPLLGATGSAMAWAEARVAAVEADLPMAPFFDGLGLLDIDRTLGSEPDGRPLTKMSLRKPPRRILPPRGVARANPVATSVLVTHRQLARPTQLPTLRSVAAADLPRFCRWLL